MFSVRVVFSFQSQILFGLWWLSSEGWLSLRLHLFLFHLLALGSDALQELICKLKETPRYTKAVLPNRHVSMCLFGFCLFIC